MAVWTKSGRATTIVIIMFLGAMAGCSKAKPAATAAQTATQEARQPTGLESIPMANPAKYPRLSNMSEWKNPYFVVRDDGIGMVDLSNHEIHILKIEEIPAELAALPFDAWPYGRVVMVAQAAPSNPTVQAKADVRKNRALLLGTLKELDVQFREAP